MVILCFLLSIIDKKGGIDLKKKSEIREILNEYKDKLEACKTDIADVAMNVDIDIEDKNKYMYKMQPKYTSYNAVVAVLENILEVGVVKDNQDDQDDE